MNVVEPLRGILASEDQPERHALPLGRGTWHVLFGHGERPLLLPAADYRLQARCLTYFVPGGPKAACARALLRANAVLSGLGLLPQLRIDCGPHGFLSGQVPPGRHAHSAVQIGTPGPFRKATVLLISAHGEGYVHAKIAMVPGADRQITQEAGQLRELEAQRELEGRIPRVLAEDCAPNGRRYLVTTLAPGALSTREFTAAHLAFLASLGRAHRVVMDFATSPCCEFLESKLDAIGPHLTPVEHSVLKGALRDCRTLLGHWTGPFVLGHGDFVPWNIRVHGDRIFVFDWEYAHAGANPLADAFNFRIMQRAMSRRAPGAEFLTHTLRHVQQAAGKLYPEFTWRTRAVSGLGLAYLLEVLLHYTVASRSLVRTHPVIASYLRLIEGRTAWMAT
jgi:hypothetical protein